MVSDNRVRICRDRYTLGTGGKAKETLVVGSSPATFRLSLCLGSWEDKEHRQQEGRKEPLTGDRWLEGMDP